MSKRQSQQSYSHHPLTHLPTYLATSFNILYSKFKSRRVRPRCPCVGRHRTSWLGGNSRGRWQWPVRPSLLNPILTDKVGRSPYSSALVTRSRQLALRKHGGKRGPQFWPNLETSETFLMDLEVPCSGDFCVSESRIFFSLFLPRGFGVSDLSFFLSVWSSGVELLRVHESSCRYSL